MLATARRYGRDAHAALALADARRLPLRYDDGPDRFLAVAERFSR